jgi:hypothetical protein
VDLTRLDDALAAKDINTGVLALDQARAQLDNVWGRQTAIYVRALADRLALEGNLTADRIFIYATELATQMALNGILGSILPSSVYLPPQFEPPTVVADREALVLSASNDLMIQALAGAIEYYGQQDVSDYASEVLATAILEVATSFSLDDGLTEITAQLDAAKDTVAALPTARLNEPRYYIVRRNDTLRDIAEVVMNDREAWMQMVETYRLVAPYFSDTPRTGCLSPGHRMVILPTPETVNDAPGLGMTLGMDAGPNEFGQEVWDLVATDDGDLRALVGMQGFAADLGLRVGTPLGDLPDVPNYGMPELGGMPATVRTIITALAWGETMREDPRVERVIPRSVAARSNVLTGVLADKFVVIPKAALLRS